jgi:uncharacterized membrane protein
MYRPTRLEAFSDGVFAIAITLLVLDLAVPTRDSLHGQSLASVLAHQWPSYFAYLVSFLVIGIIWVNHTAMCTLLVRVDRLTLFANLLLLLTVSVIPFPTRLLSEYLTAGDSSAHTAAAIYSATMLVMGLAFSLFFLSIAHNDALTDAPLSPATVRATLRRFSIGTVIYAGTIGLSFVSAVATLAVHGLLALYYCFDQLAPARSTNVE